MATILGIASYHHDAAAALVVDGKLVSASQEERFSRVKNDARFPLNAIQSCLAESGLGPEAIDQVVFYEKPLPKFERLLETYLAFAPKGFRSFSTSMPLWLSEKLFMKRQILESLRKGLGSNVDWSSKLLFSDHHLSHAASAFFPSPFERAAVLTMDGVGEWATTTLGVGSGNSIELLKEIWFPHSLGLLYSAFTAFTGFRVNSGEYKLMGLAPYGEPVFAQLITDELIDIRPDGSFRLNMDYFSFATHLGMTNEKFSELFGGPGRKPESDVTQREMDLAASVQQVLETVVMRLAKSIASDTSEENLCLAGGVALNCVANGVLHRSGLFKKIWIQPAAGDAGGAVGAALAVHHLVEGAPRKVNPKVDGMSGSFLGSSYSQPQIEEVLTGLGAIFETVEEEELLDRTVRSLEGGQAVGWFQGRMEFGPRALGNRSILADPRSSTVQKTLNLKVKFRESFRPFAPSVLASSAHEWFELDVDSPYMLLVAGLNKAKTIALSTAQKKLRGISLLNVPKSEIPGVTHVDYSARVQTVHESTNLQYFRLLERFYHFTGCPVLVNTSFNVRGEPIVESPEDAFRCFMGTDLDVLVVGRAFLEKKRQVSSFAENYRDRYYLD